MMSQLYRRLHTLGSIPRSWFSRQTAALQWSSQARQFQLHCLVVQWWRRLVSYGFGERFFLCYQEKWYFACFIFARESTKMEFLTWLGLRQRRPLMGQKNRRKLIHVLWAFFHSLVVGDFGIALSSTDKAWGDWKSCWPRGRRSREPEPASSSMLLWRGIAKLVISCVS